MKLVIVESPYAAENPLQRDLNIRYARKACRDALSQGEAAWASHLIWPQFLDDDDPEMRRLGIEAGLEWSRVADYHVFYTDRGWSKGMLAALDYCIKHKRSFFLRAMAGSVQPPPERS